MKRPILKKRNHALTQYQIMHVEIVFFFYSVAVVYE